MSNTKIQGKQCQSTDFYRADDSAPQKSQVAPDGPKTETSKCPADRHTKKSSREATQGRRLSQLASSKKMTPGAQMSPSPALEADPRVDRYRYNKAEQRYQVTKYDPTQVRFGENGDALVGATITINGREQPLKRAVGMLDATLDAKFKSLTRIEDLPAGQGKLFAAGDTTPVRTDLIKARAYLKNAKSELEAGHPKAAKKLFARAATHVDDAGKEMRVAVDNIKKRVGLTVGTLKVLKAAGTAADIGLCIVGVGLGVKMARTLLATGASEVTKVAAKKFASKAAQIVAKKVVLKPVAKAAANAVF